MMHGGYGGGYWAVWWDMPWWWGTLSVLVVALGVWFSARILQRAGLSPWWSLLFLFPMLYFIGLWVFAFMRWPRIDSVRVTPPSDYEGGWNIPPRPDNEPPRGAGRES